MPLSRAQLAHLALVLLIAWTPALSYAGHWDELASPAPSAQGSPAHEHGEEHARHCHTSLGSCSDQASTPALVGRVAGVALPPDPPAIATPTDAAAPVLGLAIAPPEPPPRTTA